MADTYSDAAAKLAAWKAEIFLIAGDEARAKFWLKEAEKLIETAEEVKREE